MSIDEKKVVELERELEEARLRYDLSDEIAETVGAPLIRWYLDNSLPDKARRVWESCGSRYEPRRYVDLALEISHGLLADEEWDLANQVFWYAYEIAKRLDEGTLEVRTEALVHRAKSFTGKGDFESAWGSHFDLQVLGIKAQNLRVQAISEMGMGDASCLLEDWEDAADNYESAWHDYRTIGELDLAAVAAANAAHALLLADNDWERTLWCLSAAERCCSEVETSRHVGTKALKIGELLEDDELDHTALRAYEIASRSFTKADDFFEQGRAKSKAAMSRMRLADDYIGKGVLNEAMRLLKLAHVELASLGDARAEATTSKIAAIKSKM